MPPATPVTIPAASTVATAVVALVHVPLPVVSASDVVDPAHTVVMPVIAPTAGSGFTVAIAVV